MWNTLIYRGMNGTSVEEADQQIFVRHRSLKQTYFHLYIFWTGPVSEPRLSRPPTLTRLCRIRRKILSPSVTSACARLRLPCVYRVFALTSLRRFVDQLCLPLWDMFGAHNVEVPYEPVDVGARARVRVYAFSCLNAHSDRRRKRRRRTVRHRPALWRKLAAKLSARRREPSRENAKRRQRHRIRNKRHSRRRRRNRDEHGGTTYRAELGS